jgi:hypothetical protein
MVMRFKSVWAAGALSGALALASTPHPTPGAFQPCGLMHYSPTKHISNCGCIALYRKQQGRRIGELRLRIRNGIMSPVAPRLTITAQPCLAALHRTQVRNDSAIGSVMVMEQCAPFVSRSGHVHIRQTFKGLGHFTSPSES